VAVKIKDLMALLKFGLSFTVLLSSVLGYLIAVYKNNLSFEISTVISLFIGGLLITFSANTFNQIIEIEQDGKMNRTLKRPLVTKSIGISTAFLIALICAIIGFIILYLGTNTLTSILAISSLILYAFVYTPSKRLTSLCVLIGAIPGAFPPLIGYVAATNGLDFWAFYIFGFQFLWQFPHFWAIAWQLNDDYTKAGYQMLPTKSGKSKINAIIILIYTLICVTISLLPFFIGQMHLIGFSIICAMGIYFLYKNYLLLKYLDNTSAKNLMFASLLYMPIVLVILIF